MLKLSIGFTFLCFARVVAGRDGNPAQESGQFSGPITLNAGVQEQLGKDHIRARGYVDIQAGEVRLQADQVEFWRDEMRVVAEGNVVFQQGTQKIVGTRMTMDLRKRTGKFYNAYGTAGEDFFFYGDIIERESEDVYVIHGGAFTSCAQPVPRWQFTAGKARIRVDHNLQLHNAFFKVKSVPVFYLPYLYYPISEEDRATGFLLPRIGTSTLKGFLVSEAFFWAINRSMDATFTVDSYSKSGVGGGAEHRYVLSEASRGEFRTYFIQDRVTRQREYTLAYSLNQNLPAGFRAVSRADYFSSFDFQQRFQENLDAATRRSKRASGNIYRTWSHYNFRVLFDRNETAFGDRVALRQMLPQVSFGSRPARLGGSPFLFSFDTEASRLSRTQRNEPFEYQRFDLLPTLSYPFTRLSFLTFRTSLTGRYTHYSARQEGQQPLDEGIDRRYYEIGFDMRGPTFGRIFDTPGNFYAERYKHVIEPQLVYSYRSRIDTFDDLPKFDSGDYIPGTNQLSFSLVNRFFAKRQVGGAAVAAPVEFLTWTVSQRYFFNIGASLYDPQFTTPFFSPDGTPSRYSPVTSRLRFRPGPGLSANWDLEYDVNFKKLRSLSLAGNFSGPWGSASATWSRTAVLRSDVVRNHLRGNTSLNFGQRIQTSFEASYDLTRRNLQQSRAAFTYNIQCCGFLVEYARYNFGGFRDENVIRFGITLAHVGTFGSFLGGPGRVQ